MPDMENTQLKTRSCIYIDWSFRLKIMFVMLLGLHVQESVTQVNVTVEEWVDIQERTVMTCSSNGITQLEWFRSSLSAATPDGATLIYELIGGVNTPGSDINASRYEFVPSGNFPLTIKSVELEDEGKYWCKVIAMGIEQQEDGPLRIRVKPTSILLEDLRTGMNYSSGSVEVIQGLNHFACIVQGIKPEAEFTWTLDSATLSGSVETNVPNSGDARLVDSRSEQNFTVSGDSTLTCSAHNKKDGTTSPDKTVTVQLKPIKDPCEPNPCENGGACTPKPSLDGYQCDCPPGTLEPNCTASTTPESTAKSTTIGGPGPSTPTETPSPTRPTSPDGLSVGAIVGIAIACVVAVVVMIGILTYCCCKKQEKKKNDIPMRKPGEVEEKNHLEKDDRDGS